ncbi:MAG: hypothetical protein MJK18_05850 [Bdellovibrionales bacterium]|nr:hypothetical protein [Bdellovibrionales bacterium]
MESYKPPKTPVIKKLISNWIVQLVILLVVVLVVVLRDSFSSSTPTRNEVEAPRPRELKSSQSNNYASERESAKTERPARERTVTPKSKVATTSQPTNTNEKAQSEEKSYGPLKQNINARLYLAPRNQIDSLVSNAQKIDDGIGYASVSAFNEATSNNRQDWKKADSIRKSFQFNRPSILFIGERSSESDKNIGFYFEVTVFDTSDEQTINFELRSWNELKGTGGQEDAISYEFSVPRGEVTVISGLVSKDQGFTEDDRTLFESSGSLRILNSEGFLEDYNDIVLVLQLN